VPCHPPGYHREVTTTTTSVAPQRTDLARIAVIGAGALLFGVLLVLVRLQWLPLESVDHGIAASLNHAVAGHHAIVLVLGFVSRLGSFGILGWLVIVGVVLLTVRRRYRLALYLAAAMVGELILDPTLKIAVGRLRPVVSHPIATGGGNSFPSGHALASIVGYGALLLVFAPALHRRARTPVVAGLAVLVAAIGFSRLALGVHYLSDVVGAWALGIAWLGLSAYAFELWRYEHGRRVTRPVAEGLEPEAARDLKPTVRGGDEAVIRTRRAVAGGVVAWVLVFGALCALGIPLARYHKGNGNILGDTTIPHFLAAHRTPTRDLVSFLGSEAGNTHAILAVGLIAGAVVLGVVRRWRPVVFLLVTMFGELTLFLASAAIVGRNRPDVPHLDGRLPTSSFPSGHVAATICLYTAIVVLTLPRTRAWWRWLLVTLAVLMPVWVALSRLYRGMHHPTDLLGAVLLAAGWLTAMVYLVRPNCDLDAAPRRSVPARAPVAAGRR
jgi:undecaprenyl-diphosphatase